MIAERLHLLRQQMEQLSLNAYILTNNDPHQSEYVPDHYKARAYFSGFTGSKGTLVVLKDKAALWVDGRFEIQAAHELEGSGIEIHITLRRVGSSYGEWLLKELGDGDGVGFDGRTLAYRDYLLLEQVLKTKRIKLKPQIDFIDRIWKERPPLVTSPIIIHPQFYAIVSPYEKLEDVQKTMAEHGVDYYIVSDLDDIAWLTNLRSRQIPYNPLFYAFMLIGKHESILFADMKRFDRPLIQHLSESRILLQDYQDIESFVRSLKRTAVVLCDDSKTSVWLVRALPPEMRLVRHHDILALKRAVKHPLQIEKSREAQHREGLYMYKYLYWLKHKRGRGLLNEVTATRYYHQLRKKHPLYYDECFYTVSAYKENGALMHYNPTHAPKALKGAGFYLINTGAHYFDGTTDLSRTLFFGKPMAQHKTHYTAILKALIGISTARFIKGTTGTQLDVLARRHIWALGLDYHCSTGHGIGYMQAIHEGPHAISNTINPTALEPGMLLTLEPGIYIENVYGMRLENIVCVTEVPSDTAEQFYGFETLTLCPFERRMIAVELLEDSEIDWIDAYHQRCYEVLKDHLKLEERRCLRKDTAPLK